jgi:hypothetical protein
MNTEPNYSKNENNFIQFETGTDRLNSDHQVFIWDLENN